MASGRAKGRRNAKLARAPGAALALCRLQVWSVPGRVEPEGVIRRGLRVCALCTVQGCPVDCAPRRARLSADARWKRGPALRPGSCRQGSARRLLVGRPARARRLAGRLLTGRARGGLPGGRDPADKAWRSAPPLASSNHDEACASAAWRGRSRGASPRRSAREPRQEIGGQSPPGSLGRRPGDRQPRHGGSRPVSRASSGHLGARARDSGSASRGAAPRGAHDGR